MPEIHSNGGMNKHKAGAGRTFLVLLLVLSVTRLCPGYSVLTHEQIVDLLLRDQIQPLLVKLFPRASENDLRKAHAYAYGVCMIKHMGYYSFGKKYFSE